MVLDCPYENHVWMPFREVPWNCVAFGLLYWELDGGGVTRAIKKVVGEAEGHHVKALKAALADAQEKMAQQGA